MNKGINNYLLPKKDKLYIYIKKQNNKVYYMIEKMLYLILE